jgi:hypothetical protein
MEKLNKSPIVTPRENRIDNMTPISVAPEGIDSEDPDPLSVSSV